MSCKTITLDNGYDCMYCNTMDKSKLKKTKKGSVAYEDADFALQHAVVRGVDQAELDELRKIRDSLQ
jgi:hypothetical protein